MRENMKTYPHVRAMRHCLGCGGPKRIGWLVCEDCHNTAQLIHDQGYGPDIISVLSHAESQFDDDGRPLPKDER